MSSYFTVREYGAMYWVVPREANRTLPLARVSLGFSEVQSTFDEPFWVKQYWFSSRSKKGARTPRLMVRASSRKRPRYSSENWFSEAIDLRSRFWRA